MPSVPRKNIRLARDEYVGRRIYFITICTENRCAIFHNPKRARAAIESLERVSKSMNVLVHAFCVMPDHVHILVEGKSVTSDVVKFVGQWKQSTGYLFRHELPRRFWQRRFYDHILRHAEDSDPIAWYIWMNPVRKGMVTEPQQYPFSGSFTVKWPKTTAGNMVWVPPWKAVVGSNENLQWRSDPMKTRRRGLQWRSDPMKTRRRGLQWRSDPMKTRRRGRAKARPYNGAQRAQF